MAYKLKGKYADDLMHFEGNAQLLRLVTKLSYVVDEHGMNLSYPVLASFIKYPCPSSCINKSKLSTKKMGYFVAEEEIFTSICGTLGLHHCRHPLAFLLEAADDIAYLSADIEDAQHKGIVSVDCLVSYLESAKDDKIVQHVLSEICRYKKDANKVNYPDVDGYIMPDTPGLAVWKSGHIGVYIGNGEVIEAMGTKYGVVKTQLEGRGWTHWLEVPGIEYE